jgi:diacylglycerol kinase (ATP)
VTAPRPDTGSDKKAVPVLWNSNAGQKVRGPLSAAADDQLREVMSEAGLTAEIHPTESAEQAQALLAELVDGGHRLIVAAGGDGTIGQLGRLLLGSDVTLGMLPLGSVMNIARMLGVPRDLAGAAQAIAAGRSATIDVGEANSEIFFETASVGLNAAIFKEAQQFEEGVRSSPLRAFAAAFRYRPARMTIHLDDGEVVTTHGLMVTISNGAYTGVAITVAPDARLNDGRFDVRVFRHFSKFELLRHLASITFGRRRYIPHVSTYRSRTVRVEGRRPLPCRADANDLGTTPLECRVRPASLKVIVGPGYSDGRAIPDSGQDA